MNSSSWLEYYEINRLHRIEPEWKAPCLIPETLRQQLGISLSHFQLGETGGGTFLLREAAKQTDPNDLAALRLFILEEKEHARLLACLVERLGGHLVHRHWTHPALQTGTPRRRIQLRNPDAPHRRDPRHRLL